MRKITFGLFVDYFIYLLVIVIEHILVILPESWAFAFGRFLGRLVSKTRKAAVLGPLPR